MTQTQRSDRAISRDVSRRTLAVLAACLAVFATAHVPAAGAKYLSAEGQGPSGAGSHAAEARGTAGAAPAAPIGCGASISGQLDPSDPVFSDGTWVDEYELSLARPATVTIEMSGGFDPFVYVNVAPGLRDGNAINFGGGVIAVSCDPPCSATRFPLTFDVAAGTYFLWANSLAALPEGTYPYQLTVSCVDNVLSRRSRRLCDPDQVRAGAVCIDTYEASVWSIPDPTGANAMLVKKLRRGEATAADLTTAGATQLGVASDDYPCADNGQDCKDRIFAASLPGVLPSARITWFQSQAACANSLKRLPRNAEWQQAVLGSPDPGGDDGIADCNTTNGFEAVATGSRSACVSSWGAYDMVGNLFELTADWVPFGAMGCPGWGTFSDDMMCLAGADGGIETPAALVRGGSAGYETSSGPLSVHGDTPTYATDIYGFRCAR